MVIRILLAFILWFSTILTASAQADSAIVRQLREKGIHFSHNNSVVLLMNGQEKFDDLFTAIRQARKSIHMEYFNFRNDSINKELITLLAEKVKDSVEVRILFDGFGNVSNNQPLKKDISNKSGNKELRFTNSIPWSFRGLMTSSIETTAR